MHFLNLHLMNFKQVFELITTKSYIFAASEFLIYHLFINFSKKFFLIYRNRPSFVAPQQIDENHARK
jgi:hypothetical protein